MKYLLVTLSAISFMFTEVYSIVPKYIPQKGILSQRSLDDGSYQPSARADIVSKRFPVNIALKNSEKFGVELPVEEDNRSNRLAEVNAKEAIDSSEIGYNDSVEDFDDYSDEEARGVIKKEKDLHHLVADDVKKIIRDKNGVPKNYKTIIFSDNKRVRRLANPAYEGRYKPQDINDIFVTVPVSRPQSPNANLGNKNTMIEAKKHLKNSRQKRNANIIVEENLGKSISIFTFSGRPSLLNQDLAFKNIHT